MSRSFHCVVYPTALLVLFLGCGRDPDSAEKIATSTVQRYATIRPARTALRRITAQPGRVEAYEEAPIVARVPGYVRKVAVDIGQHVKTSEILIELSAPELTDAVHLRQAELNQAKAAVTQANAAQAAAVSKIKTAEAAVHEAEAHTDRAQSEFLRVGDELKRVEQLAQSNAVSRKLVDETRHAHRTAVAGRKEAVAKIALATAALDEARSLAAKAAADVEGAKARVSVAEANLDQARTMASYLTIRAPFDAVVSSRLVHTGHFVGGGAATRPHLVLLRTDPVRVTIDVPENEASFVHPGEAVTIHVPALPKAKIIGVVARGSNSLNPNNRTLRVEIDVPNADGRLISGMYVTAIVTVADRKNVLVLPVSAVARTPEGGESCFVIEGGKLKRRPIETGLVAGDSVEVVTGLAGGEEVVKSASASLVDGSPAEPFPPAPIPPK